MHSCPNSDIHVIIPFSSLFPDALMGLGWGWSRSLRKATSENGRENGKNTMKCLRKKHENS